MTDKLHTGTFTVNSSTVTTLAVTGKGTDAICKGDTGGTLLNAAGQIVGVNSRSWQGGCFGTAPTESRTGAVSTRTDDLVGWIAASSPDGLGASTDFNADGKTDIALTGATGWDCLPVATSKGDGTFTTTCNAPKGGYWGFWASSPGVTVI